MNEFLAIKFCKNYSGLISQSTMADWRNDENTSLSRTFMTSVIAGHLRVDFNVPEEEVEHRSILLEEEWFNRASSFSVYNRVLAIRPFIWYTTLPLCDPLHEVISLLRGEDQVMRRHVATCRDGACQLPHCTYCRSVIYHLVRCKCDSCALCTLMKYCAGKAIMRIQEKQKVNVAIQGLLGLTYG